MNQQSNMSIRALAEESLEVAIKHMQTRLGVESGDVAASFFTGSAEMIIRELFQNYIATECAVVADSSLTRIEVAPPCAYCKADMHHLYCSPTMAEPMGGDW